MEMAYPRRLTEEGIIRASRQILEDEGELQIRVLARKLKVQPASLYRYFKSMAHLKRRVAEEGYRMLGVAWREAAERERTVGSLAAAYRAFAAAHPRLYHLMHEPEMQVVPPDSDLARLILQPLAEAMDLSMADPRFVENMRAFRCFIHGFASLEQSGQFYWKKGGDGEAAFRRGVAFFAQAYRRRLHRRPAA